LLSVLQHEIDKIRGSEILLGGPYDLEAKAASRPLRLVFLLPYGHEYSLLCMGPLALYDLINRTPDVPAVAERAIVYDCLARDGNALKVPNGHSYRSIENPAPVSAADVVGVSITNAGDLVSLFRLLDVAGIPRRCADRRIGVHPLVVGGNGGFANPEVLADYLDVVAMGEAESSMLDLITILHRCLADGSGKQAVLEALAQVPGLYVPALYECDLAEGGGVHALRPNHSGIPARVTPQFLKVADLHWAHFVAPITEGTRAMIVPTLGCRHSCHFCTLGVPDFRQAPFALLQEYLEELERHGVRQVVVSSPTFTQYKKACELLERLADYAHRSGGTVSTIIGSVRADELTDRYLSAVARVGDFGHLFAELNLSGTRGIVTIAPEFASPDLVQIFNKTMTHHRVHKALDLLRASPDVGHVMLYFIVGVPGETRADRLAIADYAVDVHERLGRPDGTMIVKLQQFMPKPGTAAQRLEMADPDMIDGQIEEIRDRLRALVGAESYERCYRVLWGESSRLLLESVCLRGDRRIGHVLEELYDVGADLTRMSGECLRAALRAHGLDHARYLRRIGLEEILPWEVVNTVDRRQEKQLMEALDHRMSA
jgi:radical SAM superfamily enzyme YgiQ (UPF0313 family)